ncbi:F-box family protein with DUF295 [Prunus dulcis]|uniref:F-box family protein with DUF295 n=1 Tax=Prunus dulcis TaxID=3755 RepID=A0A4Y1S098_PRUDU|nr:F-box family protein with DUF295 [Prunus dulcis]
MVEHRLQETFAPVARLDTIRALVALAAQKKWRIYQLDVKSAFQNGELEEEIYVEQPQGFIKQRGEDKALNLKKYGLKQAPQAWSSCIDKYFINAGFRRSKSERLSTPKLKFKKDMMKTFEMSDLGVMHYFLGIEINQEEDGIFICRKEYTENDKTRPNFHFGIRAKSCACPTPGKCRAKMTFLPFLLQFIFKIPLDFCRKFDRVSPQFSKVHGLSRIFLQTLPDFEARRLRVARWWILCTLRPGGEKQVLNCEWTKSLGRHTVHPSRKLAKSGDYDQPVPPADSSMTPSQLESLWQDAGTVVSLIRNPGRSRDTESAEPQSWQVSGHQVCQPQILALTVQASP